MTDIEWKRVEQGLKSGSYNLLLGAGVSADSKSRSTHAKHIGNLPSASQLCQDLCDIKPNVRSNSSLNRVFRTLNEEERDIHITKRFINAIPGPTVEAITKFRWRRIFTLNIDDALENAYLKNSTSRQTFKSLNYIDEYQDFQDKNIVPIIHLHGYAKKPSDDYIFDNKQYMRSISENKLWAHILGDIIASHPFIVMGTSLEEPDITYFLSERDSIRVRADKPPSIIVEPESDDGTIQDCRDYRLSLVEQTALEFLNDLDGRFPDRPSLLQSIESELGTSMPDEIDTHELALFHSDFEKVPVKNLGTERITLNFALGHSASWSDIDCDADVARDNTITANSMVEDLPAGRLALILGDAGSGTTTIIRRLAKEYAETIPNVFWCRAVGRINVTSLRNYIHALNEEVIIFIDNIADHAQEVTEILGFDDLKSIKIVGAERIYREEHIRRVIGRDRIKKIFIRGLSSQEAEALISRYVDVGLSSSPEAVRDATAFSKSIEGDSIALACCRILNNFDPLDTIIDRSFSDATTNEKRAYLISAICSYCYRDGILYNVLGKILSGYDVERQMDEHGPLPVEFHDHGEDEYVIPLNEAISTGILRRMKRRNTLEILAAFIDIAINIRPYVNLRTIVAGDPNARLAARLFDYDTVVREFLDSNMATKFYEQTRKTWQWNSRYWHQVALMKLDQASSSTDQTEKSLLVDEAALHARHAQSIEPNHAFTLTTLAKILFGKMINLRIANPNDLEEAVNAAHKAVMNERNRYRPSIHPYMVLFRGVNSLAEQNPPYSLSARQKIRGLIQDAKNKFPRDEDLLNEAAKTAAII